MQEANYEMSLNTLSKVKTKWKCSSWNSNSYSEDKILKNVGKNWLRVVFHMTCHKLLVFFTRRPELSHPV